ncbi:hypothetical protein FRB96_006165 [Tulasnella sp. 330]|nr:hypothetical protein FRB96_006165 [Tulasnella sp. 330]
MSYDQNNYFVAEPETYNNSFEEQRNSSETGGVLFPRAATTGAWPQTPQPYSQPGYPSTPQSGYSLPVSTASYTPPAYAQPNQYPLQGQWPQQEAYHYPQTRQSTDKGFGEDVTRLGRKTKKSLKMIVSVVQAATHLSRPHLNQQPPPVGALNAPADPNPQPWLPPPPGFSTDVAMPQPQQEPVYPPYHPVHRYQGQAYPMVPLNSQAGPSGPRPY